ncbi:MAG TPA: hypothetical protein PKC59_02455 [Burkholderiaceae bacterium]|nr:hypothetical protein [Burkholderiaceae bacterium]HMX10907.1 hypothetical protein [Burkholderiaceae bacterium]HMZ01768.1 hypothetical protein [Burkholderiaceae bacterium]HNG78062.1 hypothetical protein [Burkholderiaceae bacterium]
MRTAPSFRLAAPTCRLWRHTVLAAWLTSGTVLAAWLLTAWWWLDLDAPKAVAAGLATALWFLSRPTQPALRIDLSWDGQGWWAVAPLSARGEALPCSVSVAIDLGVWLLLRLRPLAEGPSWRRPVHWVALSESAVGPNWHGLRCALYSARRMTAPEPALTPPPTEDRPLPR